MKCIPHVWLLYMASIPYYLILLCSVATTASPAKGESELLEAGIAIRQEAHYVVAQKNGRLLLNCSVVAEDEFGTLEITWLKDSVPVQLDSRVYLAQNGSLFFRRVIHRKRKGQSDEGFYECLAKNSIGTIVGRMVKVEIANIARNFLKEPSGPADAYVGGVARFECEVRAVPQPLYVWEKDLTPLPQNDNRFTKLSTGILQISNVTLSDTGQYRCIAAQGALHELPDEVDDIQLKRSVEASLDVKIDSGNRPPKILAGPGNVTTEEGSTVVLECLVDGNPSPIITWHRQGGIPIRADRVLREKGNLKLLEAEPDDEGIYICTATSPLFEPVHISGQVTVKTFPRLEKEPVSIQYPMARVVRFPCEATGKPRPEMHWLKDGEPVPSDGRILLRKNVLIITQSVLSDSGYYQCIAKNSVGYVMSMARLKVFSKDDAPSPPSWIYAEATSSTDVTVQWSSVEAKECCPTLAYTVHYEAANSGNDAQNLVVVNRDIVHLERLQPYTNYSIYVRAYSKTGASGNSKMVTAQTMESVPNSAPLIRLYSESAASITVEWEELPQSDQNGVIVGYKLFYLEEGVGTHNTIIVSGTTYKYTIEGLKTDRRYLVRVLAGTKVGYPDLSEDDWPWLEYVTTGQDVLPSPPRMQVFSINATSVNITWDNKGDKSLLTFTITIWKISNKQSNVTQISASASQFIATNLENNTLYEVSLVASNEFGSSSPVIEEFQTTAIPVPPPPKELHATLHTSTSVNVVWQQPMFSEDIVYYMVRYNKKSEDGNPKDLTEYQRSNTLALLVEGLMPYTYYEFAVRAHSRHVIGKFSTPITEVTREAIPSAPLELDVRLISPGSVELMWKPPAQPNGNVTAYIVMYSNEYGQWITVKRGGTSTAVVIQNLQGIHFFKLRACNGAGESPESTTITLEVTGQEQQTGQLISTVDQKLGIIVGVTVGVVCIIICFLIVFFRKRCISDHYSQPPPPYPGNGHIPGQNQSYQTPVSTQVTIELHEVEPNTPMLTPLPENENSDSKGGGAGNLIVTPNGTRLNGFVPIRNGKKMDHMSNGHVMNFIGRHYDTESTYPNEASGLIAAMLVGETSLYEPTIHEDLEKVKADGVSNMDSVEDIDKSGEEEPEHDTSCTHNSSTNHVLPQETFMSSSEKHRVESNGQCNHGNQGSLGHMEAKVSGGHQNGVHPLSSKSERQLKEDNYFSTTSYFPSPLLRIDSCQTTQLPTSTQNSFISKSVRESPPSHVAVDRRLEHNLGQKSQPMPHNSQRGRDNLHSTAQGDCSLSQSELQVL